MIGNLEAWEPVVGDPVEGWRTWRVKQTDDGEWELRSVYHDVAWHPGKPLEARCCSHDRHLLPEHQSPAPPRFMVKRHSGWPTIGAQEYTHECGIYASRSEEEAGAFGVSLPVEGRATGVVALWGKVAVHQKGWRGQFGYPVRLTKVRAPEGLEDWELADLVASRYGIESEVVWPWQD